MGTAMTIIEYYKCEGLDLDLQDNTIMIMIARPRNISISADNEHHEDVGLNENGNVAMTYSNSNLIPTHPHNLI